jgi:hypothetical protein
MRPIRSVLLAALIATIIPLAAHADYDKGMEALKKGNPAAARTEFQKAAEAGEVRAYAPLARTTLQTARSVGDLQAARQWAEKAAASGNADAQFVYYMATVSLPELNFVDQQGKVDMKRYKALAARPISEREDEMTAYDMLGKSAAQNFPEAMLAMAGFYADNVGEGNRARAIALLDKMDKRPPLFDDLRKRLANFDQLGPSLVTVRVFDDAVAAGRTAALAAAAEKDRTKKECQQVVPLRTQRLGALEKPVWLPVAVPELQRAYLMSGNWNEIWTFDVCGAQTQVVLAFVADGLGGASVGAARQ